MGEKDCKYYGKTVLNGNKCKLCLSLNSDKILDWPKLKALADNNLNVAKLMISLYDRV